MSDCQRIVKIGYKLNSEAFNQTESVTQAALSPSTQTGVPLGLPVKEFAVKLQ